MATEYRLVFTATFDDEADRTIVAEALKSKLVTVKTLTPSIKKADLRSDEYEVRTPITENLIS